MLPIIRKKEYLPDLVDEFFGRDFMSNFLDVQTGINTPAVNIIEGKDHFKIEVAAPGLDKQDFKIDLENKVLTISCDKEEKKEEKDEKIMRREFSYCSFKRSFTLPDIVDTDKINASHKDGILFIEIPKREEAKVKPARQIKIS